MTLLQPDKCRLKKNLTLPHHFSTDQTYWKTFLFILPNHKKNYNFEKNFENNFSKIHLKNLKK
ncbi:hypothetical protein DD595_25695, partial [Enterobacter cloacae complex sp. 4DZ3-17B2]|uniref:hypothetical protein n=1 Tax=Enterobacter cloacae complex sp. 4DZ3-17B2 TaxID=2511990 RepID=UPI00102665CF